MATYKLIQDIEADDKILGPLSLRQFVFALIMSFFLYLCFVFVKNGAYFLLLFFLPPAVFFGFFAFPFGRDQPTELWALGKLNYLFKPRTRIWNQSGVKEMVTITVPKKVEHNYTNGLTQTEVRSRLAALASTIDSRGWAVKNVDTNVYTPQQQPGANSDRLIDLDTMPQAVPNYQVAAADDILDESNNPIARQFDSMIQRSTQEHRQQIIDQLNTPAPPVAAAVPQSIVTQQTAVSDGPWFINPPASLSAAAGGQTADEREAEAALALALKSSAAPNVSYGNLRTLWPLGDQRALPPLPPPPATPTPAPAATPAAANTAANTPVASPAQAVTAKSDPAILALANNNDLNVATLAREAQKAKQAAEGQLQDEIVISLH